MFFTTSSINIIYQVRNIVPRILFWKFFFFWIKQNFVHFLAKAWATWFPSLWIWVHLQEMELAIIIQLFHRFLSPQGTNMLSWKAFVTKLESISIQMLYQCFDTAFSIANIYSSTQFSSDTEEAFPIFPIAEPSTLIFIYSHLPGGNPTNFRRDNRPRDSHR